MKNQQLLIILLLAAFFRNIFPFTDIFTIVLVLLFLLNRDSFSLISIISLLVAFVYSFLIDSPIGLFPLLLSVHLLIYGLLFQKFTNKGVTPILIWLVFTTTLVLSEAIIRLLLTTGIASITVDLLYKLIVTNALVLIISFVISFKRKL